jgi:spore coat protein CotH
MSVSFDHVNKDQALGGYRALTLLNAHADPTFLHSVLYLSLVKDYLPALKANYMRVVINGESWGVYVNQQRFNKDFLRDAFGTEDGIRFKSSNRSRGGGLSYQGESPDDYRRWYEIQSGDKDESWATLMAVAKVLHETPADQLKAKLDPIFNIDGALRYLALDIVMMSGDGYWLHGSDYNLYVDTAGKLNILHHDTNEAFIAQGGGRGSTPNAEADPFVNTDDPDKAMRMKLLAVPEFRATYLEYVRDIARDSLDWATIGPRVEAHRALIRADVEADTRKLYSTEEFTTSVFGDGSPNPPADTLRGFIQRRREFLLNHPAIKSLGEPAGGPQ